MEKEGKINLDKNSAVKLREEHSQISETIELFRVSLSYLGGKEAYESIKKVIAFFDHNIDAHFTYEEQDIFNVILATGEPEIKQVVKELQQEHIVILAKYNELRDIALKHDFSFQDEKVKDDFIALSKKIMGLILNHAQKEDKKLIPWLESKGMKIKLDFKE